MAKFRPLALLRMLIAGALPVVFLFFAIMPAAAQLTPGAPNPPDPVTLTKTCAAVSGLTYSPAGSFPPGTILDCRIALTLGTGRTGLIFENIIAGGGGGGSITNCDATTTLDTPFARQLVHRTAGASDLLLCMIVNQYNRQVYRLPDQNAFSLGPGTYVWSEFVQLPTTLGCYRSITNEKHLDQIGVLGHVATARTSVSVNCNAVRTSVDGNEP